MNNPLPNSPIDPEIEKILHKCFNWYVDVYDKEATDSYFARIKDAAQQIDQHYKKKWLEIIGPDEQGHLSPESRANALQSKDEQVLNAFKRDAFRAKLRAAIDEVEG